MAAALTKRIFNDSPPAALSEQIRCACLRVPVPSTCEKASAFDRSGSLAEHGSAVQEQMQRLNGGREQSGMEVASCDADHKGEWKGEWEECEVVADHGDTCDVRIVDDGELCRGVPRRHVRNQVPAGPPPAPTEAAEAAPPPEAPGGTQATGFGCLLTGTGSYGHAATRSY